jgi:hypothetical protein
VRVAEGLDHARKYCVDPFITTRDELLVQRLSLQDRLPALVHEIAHDGCRMIVRRECRRTGNTRDAYD